jgi:hypothetical protein
MEPHVLKGEKLELRQQLCAQAAVEQDPKKLIALVKRLIDYLEKSRIA